MMRGESERDQTEIIVPTDLSDRAWTKLSLKEKKAELAAAKAKAAEGQGAREGGEQSVTEGGDECAECTEPESPGKPPESPGKPSSPRHRGHRGHRGRGRKGGVRRASRQFGR